MAHTLSGIDAAWAEAFAGQTLADDTAVAVYVEAPSPKNVPQRTYPSIAIHLLGLVEDSARLEGDSEDYKVGEDTGVDPPLSKMRDTPTPHRVQYSVDTWARGFAKHDRELIAIVNKVLGTKGTLSVENATTSEAELVWALRSGFAVVDEYDGDLPVYHKAFTYEVLVELGDEAESEVAQATEFDFTLNQSTPPTDDTAIDPAENVGSVSFVVE